MRYYVGNYFIELPVDHPLPSSQQSDPLYARGFVPLLRTVFDCIESGWIIDIGANVGDTAALIASLTSGPIICVEGEPSYVELLKQNAAKMPNDIVVCDRFVFDPVIDARSLSFVASAGSGRFDVASVHKPLDPSSPLRFIRVQELLDIAESNVRLFKTSTGGMDIPIVQQFLALRVNRPPIIFMEMNPDERLASRDTVREFLADLQERGYQAAVFTDRGAPLMFMQEIVPNLIQDLLQYPEFLQDSEAIPFRCLEVFLFPLGEREVFCEVAKGYRCRSLI